MKIEQYPTWLVPINIAKELKEIGFNEPCILYYDRNIGEILLEITVVASEKCMFKWYEPLEEFNFFYNKGIKNYITIPTWEQALAWFRAKGYYGNLEATSKGTSAYIFTPKLDFGECWEFAYEKHYEKAREALLLKLIDLYKVANQ
mgnify:FL=1